MKVIISSRLQANNHIEHNLPNVCLISITDPDGKQFDLKHDVDILRLSFHDLDRMWPNLGVKVVLFSDQDANRIARFVSDHRVETIVIHCEAGISRSAGVAAAILDFFEIPHKIFKTHIPNKMVHNKTLKALSKIQ